MLRGWGRAGKVKGTQVSPVQGGGCCAVVQDWVGSLCLGRVSPFSISAEGLGGDV